MKKLALKIDDKLERDTPFLKGHFGGKTSPPACACVHFTLVAGNNHVATL